MKTFFLKGGLGNQLFIINALYRYGRFNSQLNLDLLSEYKARRSFDSNEICKHLGIKTVKSPLKFNKYTATLAARLFPMRFANDYFQGCEISSEFTGVLKTYFRVEPKLKPETLVHIRGSDFQYVYERYEEKLVTFLTSSKIQSDQIQVTTDDLCFAKHVLDRAQLKCDYVTSLQFNEMLGYSKVITFDSTFSVWAAIISGSQLILPQTSHGLCKILKYDGVVVI